MQETVIKTVQSSEASAVSSDGLVLLDSFFKPIFVNRAATKILIYPQRPATKGYETILTSTIPSLFLSREPGAERTVVTTFQSGRRAYECRTYRMNSVVKGDSQVSLAILLQRSSKRPTALSHVSEKFKLTPREQQVLQYLSHGLTTKEIAVGMEISPNTVKNFVRMLMIKMRVSTRSGVVGKAFGTGA